MASCDGFCVFCILKRLAQRQDMPEEELQMKRDIPPVGLTGGRVHPEVESAIRRAIGGGRPLEGNLREQMSASLSYDFSGVRVHTNPEADALNRQLSARAFTVGSDIFFRRDAYDPTSICGRELIAHELAHVMQQSTGQVIGSGGSMTVCPADDAFEREAEVLAHRVIAAQEDVGPQSVQRRSRQESNYVGINAKRVPVTPSKITSFTIQRNSAANFATMATEDPATQGNLIHPYNCHMAVLYWAFRDLGDSAAKAFNRVHEIAKFNCNACKRRQKGIVTHQQIPSQWFGRHIYTHQYERVWDRLGLRDGVNVGDVLITGHRVMPNHSMVVVNMNYVGDNEQTFIRGFNNFGALNTGVINQYDNANRNIDNATLWRDDPADPPDDGPLVAELFGHATAQAHHPLYVVPYNNFIQRVTTVRLSTIISLGW